MILWWPLAAFAVLLVLYHVSEFTLAYVYMRSELSARSWLLSTPYCIAMGLATIEYCLEAWLIPSLKTKTFFIAAAGLLMTLTGDLIRKTGMLTAKANFTHMIRRHRHPHHELVTWGVYRFTRHPGYLGWFIWAVGTQVLLVNPVAFVAFAIVAWNFFNERIRVEEQYLRDFFPEYEEYAAKTPTLIPFIT